MLRIGRERTRRSGREVSAWRRCPDRAPDARTDRRPRGAGRTPGPCRARHPRPRASRKKVPRGNVLRKNAPRTSAARTGAHPMNAARTTGGYGCLMPGRLRGRGQFPDRGGRHYRRPSAEGEASGATRPPGRVVRPPTGCPCVQGPQLGRGQAALRPSWLPDEIQPGVALPDAGCPRPGPGRPAGSLGCHRFHGRPGWRLTAGPGQLRGGLVRCRHVGPGPNLRTYPEERLRGGPLRCPRGASERLKRSCRGRPNLL
jgi:hypothetical protein